MSLVFYLFEMNNQLNYSETEGHTIIQSDADHANMEHFQQIKTVTLTKKLEGISTELSDILRLVNFSIISALIGLFGIVTNVMNMIVFSKQGLNTTANISFFALALSDLLCLVAIQFLDIYLNPYLEADWVPFIPNEMQYLTCAWFTVCFGRVTSWITAYITAERCLGVALPLKVKQIVTVNRTSVLMVIIFILNLMTIVPEYCIAYLDWKFFPAKNKSFIGLVYRSNKNEAEGLIFILTSTSGMFSFIAIIILTLFLVIKLGQNSSERMKAVLSNNNSETRSIREKKTVKMVIMIASILIICYIPGTLTSLTSAFEPEFMLEGKYVNVFLTCWSIAAISNAINSSVNTILYYNMSTNYRHTFNELFSIHREKSPGV